MKQVANRSDQETVILIDYAGESIVVYSNKATTMKKLVELAKQNNLAVENEMDGKQIYGLKVRFPISMMTKLVKMNVFRAV